jgi:transcriptional regulator with XRE-family HTH domain
VRLVTPGDYIHDRRRDLGITKGEAARRLNLSQTEWRDIERGGKLPDDCTIVAVAELLRMSADGLLERYGRSSVSSPPWWASARARASGVEFKPAPPRRAVEAVDAVIRDLQLRVDAAGAAAAEAIRRAEVAEDRARSAETAALRLMEQLDSDWDGPPDYRALQ